MTDTYNGYAPSERRTTKLRRRKADNGHSIVEAETFRIGHSWRICTTHRCECGQKFSTSGPVSRLVYRWEAHKRGVVDRHDCDASH